MLTTYVNPYFLGIYGVKKSLKTAKVFNKLLKVVNSNFLFF